MERVPQQRQCPLDSELLTIASELDRIRFCSQTRIKESSRFLNVMPIVEVAAQRLRAELKKSLTVRTSPTISVTCAAVVREVPNSVARRS